MRKERLNIQFCGFGGQGLVLAATVFGTAAVLSGLNAVQTQSYGSEARGGECQAELILSQKPINSPSAAKVDLLIAMSQPALDRYLRRLSSNGTLVIDPRYVDRPGREDIRIIEVPVTQMAAEEIGQQITANMVMLGFLRQATNLISEEILLKAIGESVPERFLEANLKAADRGRQLAVEEKIVVEA
jgi:2-oxoglutarate ferredoxin oxidoreductase subunit gamma